MSFSPFYASSSAEMKAVTHALVIGFTIFHLQILEYSLYQFAFGAKASIASPKARSGFLANALNKMPGLSGMGGTR